VPTIHPVLIQGKTFPSGEHLLLLKWYFMKPVINLSEYRHNKEAKATSDAFITRLLEAVNNGSLTDKQADSEPKKHLRVISRQQN
jgi:hypothetical protein